ncbi:hypothetical protein HDV05_001909 [Chytridiales sp. JEL 0842]|nr:hypothetical protein HDV05_001909 [Chytridiales sp. JEL 0842]
MSNNHGILPPSPRIRMLGASGSGKSTLARKLSKLLGATLLEEDSIHFTNHFVLLDPAIIRKRAQDFVSSNNSCVSDSLWTDLHPILLPQTNVVIALEYPWPNRKRAAVMEWKEGKWAAETAGEDSKIKLEGDISPSNEEERQLFVFRHPRETEEWLQKLSQSLSSDVDKKDV